METVDITDEADEALEEYIDGQDMPSTKKAFVSASIMRLVVGRR